MSNSSGEVIQLHIGQAGIQIASACWELYCLEHGIDSNGRVVCSDRSYNTFFSFVRDCKVTPRLVMVDSEPTVLDEIRTGAYRHLFHPSTLISGEDDSGNNYARGYNEIGNELAPPTLDRIRSVAEACSNFAGFLVFRSLGGGTGSGLGSNIMEKLTDDYGKKCKIEFAIFPSPTISPVVVEPYNSVLTTHSNMDHSNCSILIDNEALYDICSTKLNLQSPTYTNLNRIIGQVVSCFTSALRFEGQNNVKFAEFQTNLVPFPRIHFPTVSYSPIVPISQSRDQNHSISSITNSVFDMNSQMLKVNPMDGQYVSCVLLYRGNVSPTDVNSSIQDVKSKLRNFVDWAPTGIKTGINNMPPTTIPWGDLAPTNKAVCLLANNTSIRKAWCRIVQKYNVMFDKRAFVFHYIGEGMEESFMDDARNDVCALIDAYREVNS